jgi:predicted phage terminase large subunit-like protein
MTNREDKRRLTAAACRKDFPTFIAKCFGSLNPGAPLQMNWHVLAMAHPLEEVRHGRIRRLNINGPPRTLKSLVASVAFPAFMLGHDPTKRIVAASYGMDLASHHQNSFRAIITAPWYQDLFPEMRISRTKNSESEVVTTQGGYRLATSVDGTLTGRGGNLLIVDDPLSAADALSESKRQRVNDWFRHSLLPRLDDRQNGAVIVVMQRLHDDDLSGAQLRSSDDWTVLKLAAIAEQEEKIKIGADEYYTRHVGDVLHAAREPRSVLDEILSQIGSDAFAAQFQQSPIPPSGVMIKREWIRPYDCSPARSSSSLLIQSWDVASTTGNESNFSVCTTWLVHDKVYYLIDVLRGRFDYPSLKAQAIATAGAHKPDKILIEDIGVGTALLAELRQAGLSAIGVRPEYDKATRMSIQSAKFESGRVRFPSHAPWLPALEAELFSFPNGKHDDQVDSISQALAHEISRVEWTAKHFENFAKFGEGLAMDQLWGNFLGRPW